MWGEPVTSAEKCRVECEINAKGIAGCCEYRAIGYCQFYGNGHINFVGDPHSMAVLCSNDGK